MQCMIEVFETFMITFASRVAYYYCCCVVVVVVRQLTDLEEIRVKNSTYLEFDTEEEIYKTDAKDSRTF